MGLTLARRGGQGVLSGVGHHGEDESARRQLSVTAHLVECFTPQASPFHSLPVIAVAMEPRPDLPYSMIGRSVWDSIRQTYAASNQDALGLPAELPSYDEMMGESNNRLFVGNVAYHRNNVLLDIAGHSGRQTLLVFSDGIDPDLCAIGEDALKQGLLCWDSGHTYFFGLSDGQKVWGRNWEAPADTRSTTGR